jgi:hypothetical protein
MENVDILNGHLVYFVALFGISMAIWYIFPVLVCCTKENLASRL